MNNHKEANSRHIVNVFNFILIDRKFTIKCQDKWHGKEIKWKKRFIFDTDKG